MFSGIVQRKGKLIRREKQGNQFALTFEAQPWEKPLKRGESLSVNGVCLTVTTFQKNRFTVQAVPETLATTTLSCLRLRESVNLERSLKWGERIGGHFVLGHVDGVGRVVRKGVRGKNFTLEVEVPTSVAQLLVPKGSIAIDGISFTIQKILGRTISIAVIPHTVKSTTIGNKKRGDQVNLEADVVAKHLARLVQPVGMSFEDE